MKALDQGDVQRALSKYNESLAIKETSYAWYNLGVSATLGRGEGVGGGWRGLEGGMMVVVIS